MSISSTASSPRRLSPYTGRFSTDHRPTLNTATKRRVIARDGRCLECGSFDDLTVDHRTPVYRGGTNSSINLRTLCYLCNQRKGRREHDQRPSGVVDFDRCGLRDGVLEVVARQPPQATAGATVVLYGYDRRVEEATYLGYGKTGQLPAFVYLELSYETDG